MVITIYTLCNNYEMDIKQNMLRYVKFTCPNRGHQKLLEGVRWSKRREALRIDDQLLFTQILILKNSCSDN